MNKNYIIIGVVVLVVAVLAFVVSSSKTNEQTPTPSASLPSASGSAQTEQSSIETSPAAQSKSAIVILNSQNDSGETGVALLTETDDGKVKVDLGVNGAPLGADQPAHIHLGSCTDLGGVIYPLSNVVAGSSETTVDTSFDQLSSESSLVINVHKSAVEISVYVACGDLSP